MAARLSPEVVEARTQALGREMFARMRDYTPHPLQFAWWQERMLRVLMLDPWFKVQAFRFVDVLPMMHDDVDIARHLREYFVLPQHARQRERAPTLPAPRCGKAGGEDGHGWQPAPQAAAGDSRPGRQFTELVSWWMNFRRLDGAWPRLCAVAARRGAALMAGTFIPGATIADAERAILKLRRQQLAFTIDVLGESAVSGSEAEAYHATYMHLVDQLPRNAAAWPAAPLCDEADGEAVPRVNVSVKVTSLYPGFDGIAPEAAKKRAKEVLRPLLRQAMAGGAHLHIDMEHYAIKDLTLELCEELFSEDEFRAYPHFGLVLQAYLKDGDHDAARIVDYGRRRGTPIWVRLVKGAYWDSETVWAAQRGWPVPVWEQKWQSDACYERMTQTLLENWQHVRGAFASHNVRSLAHAMALQQLLAVPRWAFEVQMLYGMGDPIKLAAAALGYRARIYTPYGSLVSGMAYFIRRLLENTANESFLRASGDADADEDLLLENPEDTGRRCAAPESPQVVRYEFGEPLREPFVNVASTDFSRADGREQMQHALLAEKRRLGGELPLVINGQPVTTGRWFNTLNPSRPSEIVARVAEADEATVGRAVAAASAALAAWRQAGVAQRAACLQAVAQRLGARRFELAALMCLAVGKTWREADADVSEAIDYCNYYAGEARRIAAHPRRRDIEGETNEYTYLPRGVVAVIGPWNFPLALLVNMASAALVMGNTVVIKPASAAAAVAGRLMDVLREAGLPPGAANLIAGPGATVGAALVRHPDVDVVTFTGSRQVGMTINLLAAQHPAASGPKRVIAEMGGKNAIIVDSDADLDEAIKGILASAFSYAGQKCSAAARVIVINAVHDKLMGRLTEAARSKSVGPADEPTTVIGPLIDKAALDAVRGYIEVGKLEATCVVAADTSALVAATGGYFVGPHVFDDVPATARLAQEEILGPVLCIQRAADFDEAIKLFNGTAYALTGGIYSRSPENIERARAECQCGNLYINRPITGSRVDLQPYGGFKFSGTGARSGGPDYLVQYCHPRTITENTLRRGFAPSEEVVEALA